MTFQRPFKLIISFSLILISLFIVSFKRKKKPISFYKIYLNSKKTIWSNPDNDLNQKTIYFWRPCSGPPPLPNQITKEAREYDSMISLGHRLKQVSCNCVTNKADMNLVNYRKCDSIETNDKVYRLCNAEFRKKFYDSLGYTPPLGSFNETIRDKEIETLLEKRLEQEWNKLTLAN